MFIITSSGQEAAVGTAVGKASEFCAKTDKHKVSAPFSLKSQRPEGPPSLQIEPHCPNHANP
eukprot:504227-Amphidinium_carterae.1